jgi:hypothetical protein
MKVVKYILLALAIAVVAFLVYRYIYTLNTGPSDEELKERKIEDDSVVVPQALDKLNASFDSIPADSVVIDSVNPK